MSVFAIGGAVIGAAGSIYSSNKQAKAAGKAADVSKEQLEWEKEQYAKAETVLTQENGFSADNFQAGLHNIKYGMGHQATASHSTAYGGQAVESKSMDAKAVLADMDSFINKFQEALGNNTEAMETFERRYGPIMDNVATGIMNVSQERISASGREQLSLDRNTILKDMDQRLSSAGLNRSGINVEMTERMNMDFNKQSRKIDVDSYGQSVGLQAQGTQTLNSMYGVGENIRGRREQLNAGFAQGNLQGEMANAQLGTNTNIGNANRWTQNNQFNANNKTSVSMTNAGNRTRVSMANAAADTNMSQYNAGVKNTQGAAAANVHLGMAQRQQSAYLGFHSGVETPNAAPLANAYQNQANAAGQDAAGWGSFAGSILGKSKIFD